MTKKENMMEKKQWKKLLNEGTLLTEVVDFLNKPNDSSQLNFVQIILDRKIEGKTAWYRLETDGWVRRYFEPGKGYGLLLKKFKISGAGKEKGAGSRNNMLEYPIQLVYAQNQYSGEEDWYKPEYEEKAKGLLMIWMDRTKATGKDVEKFINMNISRGTYQP